MDRKENEHVMKQLITTELGQRQTISAKQYNSLQVLQMNCWELEEYIKDAVLDNPVLELDETGRDRGMQSLDLMKEHALWLQSQPVDFSGNSRPEDDEPHLEYRASDPAESLREHLKSQFDSSLTEEEYRLLSSIIDYIDPCGYLQASDSELSTVSGFSEEIVRYGIAYIQTLDPLGVGARDLAECLAIQLDMLGYREEALRIIVRDHLEDMAVGRYNKIARAAGITPQEARRLCGIVKTLNPKPAASFGESSAVPVVPDIFITVENGVPRATVNDSGAPRVYINSYYAKLSKQDEYGEAAAYLEEKLGQARWIMEAVEGRKKTLLSIVELIAGYQSAFFLDPAGQLLPLTLKQVARELGLHESTVSRAVSGKYLQCERGAYPLKYFFAAKSGGEETASRNAVKSRIKMLIRDEDPGAPLSDSQIADILQGEGITLSRRVVAKYRSELGIAGTSVRRHA